MDVESLEVKGALAFSRGFTRGRTVPKDGSPPREISRPLPDGLRQETRGERKIAALMWGPADSGPGTTP